MCLLRAKLHGTALAAEFDRIYEEANEIWNEQYMRTFTEHGPRHTEQVVRNLASLVQPLENSGNPLTPEESFVLLSAACLHDIGMQLIDDPDARRKHAQHAHDLILKSSAEIGTETRRVTLSIRDPISKEAIAKIARAHWTEYALELPQKDWINSRNIKGRLKLLGVLLATADLLDLSPVRARYFRTIHRLYDLPPESELHQKMHDHVLGIEICAPDSDIPGALQFQVEWNGDYPLLYDINEWVMQWFDSQWRQLSVALFKESNGVIQWAQPWRDFWFRPSERPILALSPMAHNILKAERAEQRRIDRKFFTTRFVGALKNKEAVVFLAPAESDFEWGLLSEWSDAHARLHDGFRVIRLESRGFDRFHPRDIAANILQQLGQPPAAHHDAIKSLASFLAQADNLNLVAIIKTDKPVTKSLHHLLSTLVQRNGSATARICLLICPKSKWPDEFGETTIVTIDGMSLPREEIEEHLRKRGYSDDQSSEFYTKMDRLELTSDPARIYAYIEEHCIY